MTQARKPRGWKIAAAVLIFLLIATLLVVEIVTTQPIRDASRTYIELLSAANHGNIPAASRLCSDHYLASHGVTMNPEGGMNGLPRIIHMNYQAWRDGNRVLICPTKYSGPVYGFVQQRGEWRFDGLAGYLKEGHLLPVVGDAPE